MPINQKLSATIFQRHLMTRIAFGIPIKVISPLGQKARWQRSFPRTTQAATLLPKSILRRMTILNSSHHMEEASRKCKRCAPGRTPFLSLTPLWRRLPRHRCGDTNSMTRRGSSRRISDTWSSTSRSWPTHSKPRKANWPLASSLTAIRPRLP